MSTNATDRTLVWIVLALLAVLFVLPALGMGFGMMGVGPMGGGWGMGDAGSHMWGDGAMPTWVFVLGAVMQLVFLAVLVGAAYLVYRALTRGRASTDPAIQELRAAYARGDLSHEEFEARRDRLEADRE